MGRFLLVAVTVLSLVWGCAPKTNTHPALIDRRQEVSNAVQVNGKQTLIRLRALVEGLGGEVGKVNETTITIRLNNIDLVVGNGPDGPEPDVKAQIMWEDQGPIVDYNAFVLVMAKTLPAVMEFRGGMLYIDPLR